jgi:hypothetical protein
MSGVPSCFVWCPITLTFVAPSTDLRYADDIVYVTEVADEKKRTRSRVWERGGSRRTMGYMASNDVVVKVVNMNSIGRISRIHE